MEHNQVIILDIRAPSVPVAELTGHTQAVNTIAWAPHSSCHLCRFDSRTSLSRAVSIKRAQHTTHLVLSVSSSFSVCSGGDDSQALIWDLTAMPKPITEPILAYNAESEINTLQWSSGQPEWVAITFNKKLQILRV